MRLHASAPLDADLEIRATTETRTGAGRRIGLRNCPFHAIARDHTDLVCGVNLALMRGLLSILDTDVDAVLDPAANRCCLAFVDAQ